MNRNNMIVRHPAAAWAAEFVLWLVVVGLVGFALTGCGSTAGVFGIASEEYVEARVEAVDEARIETAAAIVAPLEPLAPGITEYARNTAKGVVVAAPPPPDTEIPLWLQAALAALGVPVSVGVTNVMRNKARKARGEALTPEEAKAKGYFDEGAKAHG